VRRQSTEFRAGAGITMRKKINWPLCARSISVFQHSADALGKKAMTLQFSKVGCLPYQPFFSVKFLLKLPMKKHVDIC